MIHEQILNKIGHFSHIDYALFDTYTMIQKVNKNELLVIEGDICQSFYFIIEGSFVQYHMKDMDEKIVDLHLSNEWMFNQESLTEQKPSQTNIRAFSNAIVLILTLSGFHYLCSKSEAFLQFGKIMNQNKHRTALFDSALNPREKYAFINNTRPELIKHFPLKLIAAYLKLSPETLSRVRAMY